ncbi:MAG: hypothetical protein ACK55I_02730, partial [bacterium]
MASEGQPAQCLIRRKRSSSTAPTMSPSRIRAAAASAWKALIPRTSVIRAGGGTAPGWQELR